MSTSMEERRKQNRKLLTFFSRVVDRKTGRLIGYLADLTTGGALLIGEKPVEGDEVLHLRMDLPEELSADRHLDFFAKAVWCHPDEDPDFYKIGLRFMDIPWNSLSLIERVLREYSFNT